MPRLARLLFQVNDGLVHLLHSALISPQHDRLTIRHGGASSDSEMKGDDSGDRHSLDWHLIECGGGALIAVAVNIA